MEPAIVLGTHTVGLGVIRALGSMGVPVIAIYYDAKDMGYVSRYVQESIRAPHPENCEDQFIQFLIGCASRFGGGVLIPASDPTLAVISRHKNLLRRYYIVACTEWGITEGFLDKKHTYALADAIGVPAPQTTVPHSKEDVERYGEAAQYPCLVKPSQSHRYFDRFRRKMVRVDNIEEMLAAYGQATEAGLEVMLQELIPGDASQGANYNSYFVDGQALVEFTAQKVRNAPPEFGSPCVAMSKHIPEVIQPGRKILKSLGFYGYSCTEFKKDPRDGVYKLMEVNGRHNLSSLLAVHCGINFPWIQYRHLVYDEPPSNCNYQTGIYWIDMTRDVAYGLKDLGKARYTLSQYVQPYRSPHIFAILDLKDPKPFAKRCLGLFKTAI